MKIDSSMVKTFHEECEQYFFYRYVCDLVRVGAEGATQFGEGMHRACDKFFEGKTINEAFAAFKEIVPKDIDEKRTLRTGEALIRGYYKEYANQYIDEVLAIEKKMVIPIKNPNGEDIEYAGRLDKIIKWYYGIAGLDHKTTSLYISSFRDTVDISHQFTGYYKMLRELYENASGFLVDVIHVPRVLKSGEVRTDYSRFNKDISEQELEDWERHVCSVVNDITEAHKTNVWRQSGNYCRAFNRVCPYKELCMYGKTASLEDTVAMAKESEDYTCIPWTPWKGV